MHRVPTLRVHRSKRLAYVCLAGRQVYLGRAHSPEAQARYAALLAELRAGIHLESAPPAAVANRRIHQSWAPRDQIHSAGLN